MSYANQTLRDLFNFGGKDEEGEENEDGGDDVKDVKEEIDL